MNEARIGATPGRQVLRALQRYPDRTAFAWEDGSLTYRATAHLIGQMQHVFVSAGLMRGQKIAVLAGNRADAWCAGVAAQALGLAITPLHPLASLDDHIYQMVDADVQALIVDVAAFAARGEELAAAVRLDHVFTLGRAGFGVDLLAAAIAAGNASPIDIARPEDLAILNYTGGTTGRSKGTFRRNSGVIASTASILADFEISHGARYLAVAPISHVAGSKVVPTLVRGGTIHLLRGFQPDQVLRTIAEQRITLALFVPTMIYHLLDNPALDTTDLSSLELLLYGASAMSPARLAEGLARIGPVFAQLYGQTEAYPLATLSRSDHDAARPELFASCGFAVTSADVRLIGDDGEEIATGQVGEICARGPMVMDGYWKQPEQTAEALSGGWLHTGDMAYANEEGYLYIVDRKKDMIVSGGFNIYPKAVEDVLTSHPSVSAAAVIGVPDAYWGEAVTALVVMRSEAEVAPEALIDAVKQRLGAVHAPKRVEFVTELPMTGLGKVDKKTLRDRFWSGNERQVG